MAIIKHLSAPAQIGELTVDVLLSREHTYDSEVTEYPVETGFVISDHVSRKAPTLKLEVVFTPTPVTWGGMFSANDNRLQEVQKAIQDIYKKAEPVTIKLPDAIWNNMVMTSAPLARTVQDGICYRMELNFTQIIVVQQKTEEISEDDSSADAKGMAGKTEYDAGPAQTIEIGPGMTTDENGLFVPATDTSAVDRTASGRITTSQVITAATAASVLFSALR